MGHYDGCYDDDAAKEWAKENEEVIIDLGGEVERLTLRDKKFLLKIVKNLEEIKLLKKILKKFLK